MISGTATSVTYYAYDRTTSQAKTGDAANHTIRVVHDGTEITPAGSPTEIDATNMPGWYKVALTGAENTGGFMLVGGKSSTANINIQGQTWVNEASSPVYGAVTMTSLSVINSVGTAVTFSSIGGDGEGLSINGNNSGHGLAIASGASGNGVDINGSADGVHVAGGSSGSGNGASIVGVEGGLSIESVGMGSTAVAFIAGAGNGSIGFNVVSSGDNSVGVAIGSSGTNAVGLDIGGAGTGAFGAIINGSGTGLAVSGNGSDGAILISTAAGPGINLLHVTGGEPLAFIVVDATSNPGTNATFDRRFAWMSNLAQFKLDESATQQQVYAADGVTVIGTAPVSDLAGVTTRDTYV